MDLICTGSYIPFPQSRMTIGQMVEKLILQDDTVQNDTSDVDTYDVATENAIDKFDFDFSGIIAATSIDTPLTSFDLDAFHSCDIGSKFIEKAV